MDQDNINGRYVIICGVDDKNNKKKIKVDSDGSLYVNLNDSIYEKLYNKIDDLEKSLNNLKINIPDKLNIINYTDFSPNDVSTIINVNNYNYCNIFYEDETLTSLDNISLYCMLEDYSYFKLLDIPLTIYNGTRKGFILNLKITGLNSLYLINNTINIFKNAFANIYLFN
jgi:hypothetical protein